MNPKDVPIEQLVLLYIYALEHELYEAADFILSQNQEEIQREFDLLHPTGMADEEWPE